MKTSRLRSVKVKVYLEREGHYLLGNNNRMVNSKTFIRRKVNLILRVVVKLYFLLSVQPSVLLLNLGIIGKGRDHVQESEHPYTRSYHNRNCRTQVSDRNSE